MTCRAWCLMAVLLAVVTLPVRAADALSAVLDPYFHIQSQLADDSNATTKADAQALAKAADALGAGGQPIVSAANELAATTTLAAARDAFGKLSSAVIAYADTTKAAVGDHVSKVYCPMVKKRWLQKGETVKNPYFGKEMQSCGTIEKS
jgi:uncharacterized protein DUF3347